MKFHLDEMVQRPFNYAIIDEVDSILIDEARTPLIISGALDDSSEKYISINKVIPLLNENDYEKDEKSKNITLTEIGTEHVEQILKDKGIIKDGNLYDLSNISLVHHVNQALRAHKMQQADVDYIVKNDQVMIIDEFTGRMMEGRRYSDGLHQAIEAKEGVTIQSENQTLASITFQNYFRAYPKLSGMTGTAMTEEAEFADIYSLSAIEIPTNRPIARKDHNDEIYRTEEEKYEAIIEVIQDCYDRKQPILVGTTSIEKSELLANLLRKKTKIKFEVLNAKHHEREASIVAQAGVPGSVTIATNMAGRGTDIQLGGNLDMRLKEVLKGDESEEDIKKITEKLEAEIKANKEVALKAGGLYVLATERHESRRIDNQLRGRSGRQGDPGDSKFFLSLEDDLMRIFGSEKMDIMLQRLGLPRGEPIVHPFISKALEKAQEKVEERNYDLRKNLLKYDDVMNEQRKVIYEQRKEIMETDDVSETIEEMRNELIYDLISNYVPYKSSESQWDILGLKQEINKITGLNLPINQWAATEGNGSGEISDKTVEAINKFVEEKNENLPEDVSKMVEKSILLQMLDQLWKDHIATLDHMRHTILLRAYGQKDPLNEYKKEAFNLFSYMLDQLRERVTTLICRSEVQAGDIETLAEQEEQASKISNLQERHNGVLGEDEERKQTTFAYSKAEVIDPQNPSTWGKVRRNDPCPCGSGKKYKNCHGA
jgi:preprotein translocase subunit SecA